MAVAKRCEHQIDLCQCRLTAARFGPSWISAAFSGLVATAGFECKRLLKAGDVGAFRTDPPGVLPGRPGSIAFDLGLAAASIKIARPLPRVCVRVDGAQATIADRQPVYLTGCRTRERDRHGQHVIIVFRISMPVCVP